MTKVYIVEFQTGEYEDKRSSIHLATFSKDKAQKECEKMNKVLLNLHMHYENSQGHRGIIPGTTFDIDYGGAEFYMYEIEVEE